MNLRTCIREKTIIVASVVVTSVLFGCNGGAPSSLPDAPLSSANAGNAGVANSPVSQGADRSIMSAAESTGATAAAAIPALYTNALPGKSYPINVTVPAMAHATIVATITCQTTTTGSTIMSLLGSWSLEAGLCNGGKNPINGSGAHIWNSTSGAQAAPATGLPANTSLFVAATQNGTNLAVYICPLRGTCVKTNVSDTGSLASDTAAVIGGSGSGIRTFTGNIWGVAMYAPLTDAQVQTLASASINNPYLPPPPTPPPTPSPTTKPSPLPTGSGSVPAHVLTAEYFDGYGGYSGPATTMAQWTNWATGGHGVTAAIAAGMKTYEYADPWIAYEVDNGAAWNDIKPGGANSSAAAKTCSGEGIGVDTGSNQTIFTDPTNTAAAIAHYKNSINYWEAERGTNTTTMFMDDAANQEYAAHKPACGYSAQAWLTGAEKMSAGVAPTQIIANGLLNSEYLNDETSLVPLLNIANVMGGMYEDCYGFNNSEGMGAGDHAGGLNQHWTVTENTELAALATGKIFWCYGEMSGAGSSELGARLYTYANFLLTYAPNALYQVGNSTPSGLRVFPETGIVPTNPLIAAPTNVASLKTSTGAYGRQYANCYYRGSSIGACAVVTNPDNNSSHNNPFSGYGHSAVLAGAGVLDGGSVSFTGNVPGSLAPLSAAILTR